MLYRQGDVLFRQIEKLPKGKRKRLSTTVGVSHGLAPGDHYVAEVLTIGGGRFVRVSESRVRLQQGATFVHKEHDPITLPPGYYEVTIQREYSPEGVRGVID